MIKKTRYIVKKEDGVSLDTDKKKRAFEHYSRMCECFPTCNFKIVKREIVEETIAESDDYRQQKFDFAN